MVKLRLLVRAAICASFLLAPLLGRASAAAEHDDVVDRSTPRRAIAAFLVSGQAGDYVSAASVLDLSSLPPPARAERGPILAEHLGYVLEKNVWIEPELLSDEPAGNPTDGVDTERVGSVRVGGAEIPITLRHHSDGRWAFSTSTVANIPRLYEEHAPGFIESRVPATFRARAWGLAAWQWLGLILALVGAFAIGRAVTFIIARIGGRLASRTTAAWDEELVAALRRPSRFLFGVLAFNELRAALALSAAASQVLARLLTIVTIGAVAWGLVGIVGVVSGVVERRAMSSADGKNDADRNARGVKTQVRVLRRVVNVAIGIVAIALMLTQFDVVRTIGVSLLASAGVAGVVLGLAAQRTIGGLIAGIQLSFTQPIRIGDVVIVEKEWGTIEEVTLTFIVVRVWDERRLVVPISRFLEQPFENWTKYRRRSTEPSSSTWTGHSRSTSSAVSSTGSSKAIHVGTAVRRVFA